MPAVVESAAVSTVLSVEWGPDGVWPSPLAEEQPRPSASRKEMEKPRLGYSIFGDKIVVWQGGSVWPGMSLRRRPQRVRPNRSHALQSSAAEDVLDLRHVPRPFSSSQTSASRTRTHLSQPRSVEEQLGVWSFVEGDRAGSEASLRTSAVACHDTEATTGKEVKQNRTTKPDASGIGEEKKAEQSEGVDVPPPAASAGCVRGEAQEEELEEEAPPPLNAALANFAQRKVAEENSAKQQRLWQEEETTAAPSDSLAPPRNKDVGSTEEETAAVNAETLGLDPAFAPTAECQDAGALLEAEDMRLQLEMPEFNPALARFANRARLTSDGGVVEEPDSRTGYTTLIEDSAAPVDGLTCADSDLQQTEKDITPPHPEPDPSSREPGNATDPTLLDSVHAMEQRADLKEDPPSADTQAEHSLSRTNLDIGQETMLTDGIHTMPPPANSPSVSGSSRRLNVRSSFEPTIGGKSKSIGPNNSATRHGTYPRGMTVKDDTTAANVFRSLANSPAWLMLSQFEERDILNFTNEGSATPAVARPSSGGRRLQEYQEKQQRSGFSSAGSRAVKKGEIRTERVAFHDGEEVAGRLSETHDLLGHASPSESEMQGVHGAGRELFREICSPVSPSGGTESLQHSSEVTAACMLSGRLLLSATESGHLTLWDVESHTKRATVQLDAVVQKSERAARLRRQADAHRGGKGNQTGDPCFAAAVWMRENVTNIRQTEHDLREKNEEEQLRREWKQKRRASTSPGKLRTGPSAAQLGAELQAPAPLAERVDTAPTPGHCGQSSDSVESSAFSIEPNEAKAIRIQIIAPHPSDARFVLLVTTGGWVLWTDITLTHVRVYLQLDPSAVSRSLADRYKSHFLVRNNSYPSVEEDKTVSPSALLVWWDNPATLRRRPRQHDRYRFALATKTALRCYDVQIPEQPLALPVPERRHSSRYVAFFDPPQESSSWDLSRDFSEPTECCSILQAGSWGEVTAMQFHDRLSVFFLAVSSSGHLTLWLLQVGSKSILPLKQFPNPTSELFFCPKLELGVLEFFQVEPDRSDDWCMKFSQLSLRFDADASELTFAPHRVEWFAADTEVLAAVVEETASTATRPGRMRDHMSMRKRKRADHFRPAEGSKPPPQHCPLKGHIIPLTMTRGQLFLLYPGLHTFARVRFVSPASNPNITTRYTAWDTKVSTLAGAEPQYSTSKRYTREQVRPLSLEQSIESMILGSPFLRPARLSPFSISYKPKPKKRPATLPDKAPSFLQARAAPPMESHSATDSSQSFNEGSSTLLDEEAPTQQAEHRQHRMPKGMHFANGVPDGATLLERARRAYAKRHEAKTVRKIQSMYKQESAAYAQTILRRIYVRACEHVTRAQNPASCSSHAFGDFPRSVLSATSRHPIGGHSLLQAGRSAPLFSRERLGKADDYLVDTNLLRYDFIIYIIQNVHATPWIGTVPLAYSYCQGRLGMEACLFSCSDGFAIAS
ncbi:unnamed protein product [Amoebophrya sp. A120]|nr:unnamed protein product [Amoebophrya sp. A120]|eukprot:GSA120T00015298001.1